MAQRHWLDPLARRLLIVSGKLQPNPPSAPGDPAATAAMATSPRPSPANPAPATPDPGEQEEAIERDLLALQLAREPGRRLRDAREVRRAAALGWRLDVNRATASDWLRLPGCPPEQADLLVRLQAGGVQLSGPEDLQHLLALDPELLRSWLPLLEFRWYGSPSAANTASLAINAAPARELRRLPDLDEASLARLLRERQRRPFVDLADLQQRLELPAAQIEAWIGRVSFGPAPPGPSLPPAPRLRR